MYTHFWIYLEGGGDLRIFATGVCGWEVEKKNYSYNGQIENKNIPIHIIWSKIITYSYNLYPNPYLFI